MNVDTPRWVGLVGPTASGKSRIAVELALHLPLEIVSVDSALVYRGMDIGTAKPGAAERAAVPHHGIDLRAPYEPYSAAQFVCDARHAIDAIAARGRLALLVGGTMLYFKALIDGLDAMPPADAAIRRAIESEAAHRGWPALHAELALVDAHTAARLAPNDAQRIGRALEVFRASARPISAFHSKPRAGGVPALVSLEPDVRGWLHERIAARFDTMLDAGLLDEVRRLRAMPGVHAGLPALRAVGYRQAWEALDAGLEGAALRAQVRERGIASTRQLAKRQLTWLRSMPARHRVACDADDAFERVLDHVRALA
jgi:tRNA dimethylallyltransferase